MADQDALSNFDYNKISKPSVFLKWQADKPQTLRVLTTDPVIKQRIFDQGTDKENISTQVSFIVYNFTESMAQIMQASPAMARKITDYHRDPDFGGDIRKVDLKITPTGEGLERRYDIQVLPKANDLTNPMIKEAQAIDIDKLVEGGIRMSEFDPEKQKPAAMPMPSAEPVSSKKADDVVIEDIGDEPINLDDIPF